MLIGLIGLAGSGKSEVARTLTEELAFTRVKFADGLKNMVRTLLRDMGHCEDDVERCIEGDLKEVIIPELGVTPRHLMLTLGTEWGRDCVQTDIWMRLWAARADTFPNVVADDVRFPNELDAIRSRGGKIWRIERPGTSIDVGGHSSEQLARTAPADVTLHNTGTLENLRATVRALVTASRSCE